MLGVKKGKSVSDRALNGSLDLPKTSNISRPLSKGPPPPPRLKYSWLLPPILYKGVVVPCMCLATVNNHTNELIVFCRGNFLPRGASASLIRVSTVVAHFWGRVLASHPWHGVRFHVQHPRKLFEEIFGINQEIILCTSFVQFYENHIDTSHIGNTEGKCGTSAFYSYDTEVRCLYRGFCSCFLKGSQECCRQGKL